MGDQLPSVGRIVHYRLGDGDVSLIDQRLPLDGSRRNPVLAGDVYPAMVVRVFGTSVNLQVFLDGDCSYWATSRAQGDEPAQWRWPERV